MWIFFFYFSFLFFFVVLYIFFVVCVVVCFLFFIYNFFFFFKATHSYLLMLKIVLILYKKAVIEGSFVMSEIIIAQIFLSYIKDFFFCCDWDEWASGNFLPFFFLNRNETHLTRNTCNDFRLFLFVCLKEKKKFKVKK